MVWEKPPLPSLQAGHADDLLSELLQLIMERSDIPHIRRRPRYGGATVPNCAWRLYSAGVASKANSYF